MPKPDRTAPGAPGIEPRWTSSAKTGVGTALSNKSHVWFTLSHGIFNEVYYPWIDQVCVRDMGLIVTDGADFFSEEKRDAGHDVEWLADGIPAFRLVNTCRDGRYRIEKQVVTDPHRDAVLQQVRFKARQGALSDYQPHVLFAPHLGNQGKGNTAWVDEFEGVPLLFAQRDGNALALSERVSSSRAAASPYWKSRCRNVHNPMKKLIVFDLDGTLAESKSSLDDEMAALLHDLLGVVKVAVISGGDWPQFEKQLLSHLPTDARLADLSLLPTCGTKFYKYDGDWKKLYSEDFTPEEKEKIIGSLHKALGEVGYKAEKVWGEVIEDRGSQITFSALGQQAPLDEKTKWDPDFAKRKKITAILTTLIPEFSVRMGGATSIDVTKPGIDKAYGIQKLRDILGISLSEMLFIGDALFPGGNDYPAKEAGVVSLPVRGPGETKLMVTAIVACLGGAE